MDFFTYHYRLWVASLPPFRIMSMKIHLTAADSGLNCAMKDGLYHRDIRLPLDLRQPFVGMFRCHYSNHAVKAAADDRNGAIKLPAFVTVKPDDIVEIEVLAGRPVKAVVRVEHDEYNDMVLVINPDRDGRSGMFVRTCWLNRWDDKHRTLRRELYVK